MTKHNLLFCAHALCMNYVTNTFLGLLASSSVRSKQLLCFVQGQGQKSKQKHTTKNFVEFHNHSPLLIMPEPRISSLCAASKPYFVKIKRSTDRRNNICFFQLESSKDQTRTYSSLFSLLVISYSEKTCRLH